MARIQGAQILGMVLAAALLASPAAAQVKLQVAEALSESDPGTRATRDWLDRIERRAKGAVSFEHFPAERLVKAKDMLDAAQNGVADIVHLSPGHVADRLPLLTVFMLPAPATRDDLNRLGMAAWQLVRSPACDLELRNAGLRAVRVVVESPAQILATRRLVALDDIKGLRLRADGAARRPALEALGAVPIALTHADALSKIGTAELDGALMAPAGAAAVKPLSHGTRDLNLGVNVWIYAMRETAWQRLPPAARTAVLEAGGEAVAIDSKRGKSEADTAIAVLEARGVALHRMSDAEVRQLVVLLAPLDEAWVRKHQRLPAAEVLAAWRQRLAS